ncbi:MAG: hypothetical protein KDC76_00045 [Bacteroidetes bacterium]|nr:hypothetical protein [Bacteroidota bacterium]
MPVTSLDDSLSFQKYEQLMTGITISCSPTFLSLSPTRVEDDYRILQLTNRKHYTCLTIYPMNKFLWLLCGLALILPSCGPDETPSNECQPLFFGFHLSVQDIIESLQTRDSIYYRVSQYGKIDTVLFLNSGSIRDTIEFDEAPCARTNLFYERLRTFFRSENGEDSFSVELVQYRGSPVLFVVRKSYALTTASTFFWSNSLTELQLYNRTESNCFKLFNILALQGHFISSKEGFNSIGDLNLKNGYVPFSGYYKRGVGLLKMTYYLDEDNPLDYELMGE